MPIRVTLELLSVLLAGGSLAVRLMVLIVVWGVLHNSRRSGDAGDERLEILREQQQRPKVIYQERSLLERELEKLRRVMDEQEKERMIALPAPAGLEQYEERRWWQRLFSK